MAKYEYVDTRDAANPEILYRVRQRVDRRQPVDILRDVVYAARRADSMLSAVRQAGLLAAPDLERMTYEIRSRQRELRNELPGLIADAQAALEALNHQAAEVAPPLAIVEQAQLPPPGGVGGVKDLLTQASEIAELEDLDRGLALVTELGAWRPEHEGDCPHCGEALGIYLGELLIRHQVGARWLARTLVRCGYVSETCPRFVPQSVTSL